VGTAVAHRGFYLHGNYVPGSFSMAPVRDTSASAINVIACEAESLELTHSADIISETFTVERLPS
jgi:hypothetical protein